MKLAKIAFQFLDLKVKLLEIDLCMKPTYHHQDFHYISSHLEYTKCSIGNSQILRFNRLCSLEKDFNYH